MNFLIFTVLILIILYFLLRWFSNAALKKMSRGLRLLTILILVIFAILFAIGGKFLLTLPLTLASLALVKLKGLSLIQMLSLYRLIQTLRNSGRFSFNNQNATNLSTMSTQEAYRILKPGGKFFCLEFSKVENKTVSSIYNMYSSIIPVIGKVIVGDEEPYKYLTKTIDEFPSQKEFKEIIESTEFTDVNYKNIFNGIVAIHFATKAVNAE